MSAGRRNHYIPRFLLRRFASKADEKRKKYWVHQVSSKDSKEVSTKDVAVSFDFYGGPDATLEKDLQGAEKDFSKVLSDLDGGRSPQDFAKELSHFVWLHAVRTRAMRTTATDAAVEVVGQVVSHLQTDEGVAEIHRKVEDQLDTLISEYIAEQFSNANPGQRRYLRKKLRHPTARKKLLEGVKSQENTAKVVAALGSLGDLARKRLPDSSADGHNMGISKLVADGAAPDSFNGATWCLLETTEEFILGDCCVFARSDEGEIGPTLRFGGHWEELYLPISTKKALVALKSPSSPSMDAAAINRSAAECSLEFLYASNITPEVLSFAQLIGKRSAALGPGESDLLVRESRLRKVASTTTEPSQEES